MTEIRMLRDEDIDDVVKTMVEGFADYIIKVNVTEEGYRRKFMLDGVDCTASFGMFDNNAMCGVTMNAVGDWHGIPTVYDAGTVVLPEFRGRGVSTRMFEYAIPRLLEMGYRKYLLEVICENEPAVRLYEKLGFQVTRRLGVFYLDKEADFAVSPDTEFREISYKEIAGEEMFDNEALAWQNSSKWIERALEIGYGLECRAVFADDRTAAFGVMAPRSGRILRLFVKEEFRGNGFGKALLKHFEGLTEKPLICLNVDLADVNAVRFLENTNFVRKVEQYEMELDI